MHEDTQLYKVQYANGNLKEENKNSFANAASA